MKPERGFVWGKAGGLFARSFFGKRMSLLANISTLAELQEVVFGEPGADAVSRFEDRLAEREKSDIRDLIKHYKVVPPLLAALLEPAPNGAKTGINGDTLPELAQQNQRYYENLWAVLKKTPKNDCELITHILREEIRLQNVIWALRLKVYYNFENEKIAAFFIDIEDELQKTALSILNLSIYEYRDWRKSAIGNFVNRPVESAHWQIDPRFVQNEVERYIYRLCYKDLRQKQFTLDEVACFIKLKATERGILSAIAEGCKLGMTGAESLALIGMDLKDV
jgi:hypothetical protein